MLDFDVHGLSMDDPLVGAWLLDLYSGQAGSEWRMGAGPRRPNAVSSRMIITPTMILRKSRCREERCCFIFSTSKLLT
jgi:hypothetical protein